MLLRSESYEQRALFLVCMFLHHTLDRNRNYLNRSWMVGFAIRHALYIEHGIGLYREGSFTKTGNNYYIAVNISTPTINEKGLLQHIIYLCLRQSFLFTLTLARHYKPHTTLHFIQCFLSSFRCTLCTLLQHIIQFTRLANLIVTLL